jgi:hypothetical protein
LSNLAGEETAARGAVNATQENIVLFGGGGNSSEYRDPPAAVWVDGN